jgi:hypothetical protein
MIPAADSSVLHDWEFWAVVVAVATLLFGDGLLRLVANLVNRRFKWEPKPFIDRFRGFRAGVSHDYDKPRMITHAMVVAPQPLLLRMLYLLRAERIPRRILVHNLMDEAHPRTIAPGGLLPFEDQLPDETPVPAWNVFRGRVSRNTSSVRLMCLVHPVRRRPLTRNVKRVGGTRDRSSLEDRGQIEGHHESPARAD